MLIGIVGPCKSGKSTLRENLKNLNWNARQIAQEHSFVADMWRRITNPDILIYLDVDYENTIKRSNLNWKPKDLKEQKNRLKNAISEADLIIDTSSLSIQEVLTKATSFLKEVIS